MNQPLPLLPGLIFLLTGLIHGGVSVSLHESIKFKAPKHVVEQFDLQAFQWAGGMIILAVVWLVVAGIARLISGRMRSKGPPIEQSVS